MSEQTARLVSRLRTRLNHAAHRMTRAEVAFGAAVAVGAVAALWLMATLLEANLWLGTTARTALAGAVGVVVVGVSAAVLARPLGRWIGILSGPSEEDVARAVGSHHPVVADRLVNLLQLAEGKRSHAPAPMVDQAVQHLAKDLDQVSFDDVEDFGRARKALRLASLPLVGVIAFLLIAPSTFLNASERLLAPGTEFDRPAPFELSIAPGDAQLVKGDTLQVTAQATGTVPPSATLLLRDTTGTTERLTLQADSMGRFRHTVPNVRRPLRYRVVAAPVRTPWHTVEVQARPLVQRLQLTVTPPAYTGTPPRTLDPNVGDVTALPGAEVEVKATLGGPVVASAVLAFESGRTDTLSVQEGTATGAFRVRGEDRYRLRLESPEGIPNRNPIRYRTTLRTDAAPSVSFLSPDSPASLEPDLAQSLRLQLSDDFGFRRAALFYRVAKERFGEGQTEFSSIELPLSSPSSTRQTLTHEWLLAQDSGLDPQPGDEIEYYVQVWDNDTVNGPKSGRTRTQRLQMPSLSEQYDQLNETEEAAGDQLDRLQQRADSVQQQFSQLRRELRRTREADWQDRRQLQQIQKKQQATQEGAQKLSQSLEKMTQQMQRNGLSSQETTQQFQELKRIAEELSSPELQKALEELKQALSQNSPRQRQQALENARQRQQQYQKQLERTKELFKQLKAQQQLEEMARRTQELSELQKSLEEKTSERMADSTAAAPDSARTSLSDPSQTTPRSDSTGRTPNQQSSAAQDSSAQQRPSPDSSRQSRRAPRDSSSTSERARPNSSEPSNEDLAREQDRSAEKMKELMEAMEKAQNDMQDVQSAPKRQMQEMNQQLQRQNMPQQMQKNSRQLRQNQLQKARQGQRRMQKQLQNMQSQLNQMQKGMKGKKRSMNVAGLRTALQNTLRLSQRQEALRGTVEGLSGEGPVLRRYARNQKGLADGLRTVTDSLESIARRSPRMTQAIQSETGQALQAMESAVTALDERQSAAATSQQKTSMMHLNELALMLSNLLSQMQQQSMGQGMSAQQMMQQLQQMSGQQQQLNQQIQQQLNQAQGERLSRSQSERRSKLARQQRKLKQQLQNMDAGSDAQQQLMGDLQKIAKQMEASAQALERGRQREEIRQRQQQILTRLLNAQKSLRTQGKQQQRRGQEADGNAPARSPSQLPEADTPDALRRDLIRALEMDYSSSYEELIRRYFELLQEQTSEPPAPTE